MTLHTRIAHQSATLFGRHVSLRFVLIGILNTAFSFSLYATFIYLGCSVALASLLALALGIVFSFFTQSRIVFRYQSFSAFVKFLVAWSLIYFVNLALIYTLMRAGANSYIAGAIAIVPVTIFSFFIMKHAVFKRSVNDAPGRIEVR